MNERDMIIKSLSKLHASEDTIQEVINMKQQRENKKAFGAKQIFVIAAAVVLAIALAVSATAHYGLWDWIISPDRDADTQERGEIAQKVIEQAMGTEMEMANEALEDNDRGVSYYFYSEELENSLAKASVQVDESGRITMLDMRSFYPYPQPEDCPEEYIYHGFDPYANEETVRFLADLYLAEVVYPDSVAYNESIQDAARYALDYLHQEGYIEATSMDADIIQFRYFNAGSAWIEILMQNGDVYVLFLTPDDLEPTGFVLHTAEMLESYEHNSFYEMFDAVKNSTLDEYDAKQEAEFANGVG